MLCDMKNVNARHNEMVKSESTPKNGGITKNIILS